MTDDDAVSIQRLTPDNAGLLKVVGPEVFDHDVDPRYLAAFLDDPRHVMFIAVEKQTVIGMASAVEYFHPDKPPQLWINEVGVASTRRNREIGRKLVAALIDYAKDAGCVFAWLGTAADNAEAQACFASVAGVKAPQPFLLYEWDIED